MTQIIFPNSTPEVNKLLGMDKTSDDHGHEALKPGLDQVSLEIPQEPLKSKIELKLESRIAGEHTEGGIEVSEKTNPALKVVKTVLPYVAVFGVGMFLYFFFLSGTDFSSWFKRVPTQVETPKESALDTLKKSRLTEYNTWVSGFYFQVSDPKVTDPDSDNSGNGLSNFQKYLLNLNPKSYDTLNLGMADSEALASGINPLSGGNITDAQKEILEKYVDMEVVMNRLALHNLKASRTSGNVAGAQTGIRGSGTFVPSPTRIETSNTSGQSQLALNELDIDTNIPGRLEIPSLNINVPIIWSADPKNFDNDLRSGVIHYPGTAMPGQVGTTYISGHSSNYVWAKGDYNNIFSKLDKLADNTTFKVTVVQKNGRDARLFYVVTRRQEYKPTDQAQFENAGKPTVALSTCWPVGSTAKRLVVFGELSQIEK